MCGKPVHVPGVNTEYAKENPMSFKLLLTAGALAAISTLALAPSYAQLSPNLPDSIVANPNSPDSNVSNSDTSNSDAADSDASDPQTPELSGPMILQDPDSGATYLVVPDNGESGNASSDEATDQPGESPASDSAPRVRWGSGHMGVTAWA
jgi:hypothetical protein